MDRDDALAGRAVWMNEAYASADGLREFYHDIRRPMAGAFSLAGAALGRGLLGGGQVCPWLPLAGSRMEGMVADATCPV
jgi:hypothetical protein